MTIEGLGKKFQEARLARNLTLDEAARMTKIRPARLAEIEADDFSQFPSLAYAKGFLLIYGKFLDVDVTPYLDAFEDSERMTVDGYSYLQENRPQKPVSAPVAQGVLVTDQEIHRIVEFVSAQSPPAFDQSMHEKLEAASTGTDDVTEEDEELVEKCLEIIRQEKRASTSLLQRRLRLGYTRAARIVDILEQRGILGPGEGAKPREILVDLDAAV